MDKIRVAEIMVKEIMGISENATIKTAAKLMAERDIASVAVRRGDRIVGIITESDIIRKVVATGKMPVNVKAKEIMIENLVTIDSEESIENAARLMRDKDVRRLLVTDNGSDVVGIVSEFDIVSIHPALHTMIREDEIMGADLLSEDTTEFMEGLCEMCGNYSDNLDNIDGRMLCEECGGGD